MKDANLYILNDFRDTDEMYDYKKNVGYNNWIRKIQKRHVIDLENAFFSKIPDQEKKIYELLLSYVIIRKHF